MKIAVIIPTYKAHKTIKNTIASIINQMGVDFNIYLSVDGEEIGSYDYIKEFYPQVNILYSPINRGAGGARQYGIDNTTEEFITFIDADDLYSSLSGLYSLTRYFDDTTVAVWSAFTAQNDDGTFNVKDGAITWMHGKMYRRSFLDKYGIKFNSNYTNSNEDLGFNVLMVLFSNETSERIKFTNENIYIWSANPDSIVRRNNREFALTKSAEGYIQNVIYAFDYYINIQKFEVIGVIKKFISGALSNMFNLYYNFLVNTNEYFDLFIKNAKQFYKDIYSKHIDEDFTELELSEILEENHENYKMWKENLKEE